MKLFSRGRTSRAEAKVLTVETTDRNEHRCTLEVQPPMAPPFRSTLRTRAPVVANAFTYVLYNPDAPDEVALDVKRLRANGVRDGRGYHSRSWEAEAEAPEPQRIPLDDARVRLAQIDELNALYDDGGISDEDYLDRKGAILKRGPERVS